MRKIVYYVADDGTQFNDEQACVVYENSIEQECEKINDAIAIIKNHCDTTTCSKCFACEKGHYFCLFQNEPHNWEMEMK